MSYFCCVGDTNDKKIKSFYTFMGITAVLIWASNVYLLKSTLDITGSVFGIGLIYLFSAIVGLSCYAILKYDKIKNNDFSDFTKLNNDTIMIYVLFIINNIFSSLTFATSPQNDVLLQVIIISDLWTILINILLIKMLKYKIKNIHVLCLGILLGITGTIISCVGFDLKNVLFFDYIQDYSYCYIFAIISCLTWSFYCVYTKKHEKLINDDHIFISMFISGTIMTSISFASDSFSNCKHITLNFKFIGLMFYEVLIASCMAYYLWNIGYRHGNVKIISNFSILAPLLNVIFTSAFYRIDLMYNIIFGALFLVLSVVCCRRSISTPKNSLLQQYLLDDKINIQGL